MIFFILSLIHRIASVDFFVLFCLNYTVNFEMHERGGEELIVSRTLESG
jgi:hypothetical protein